MSKSVDVDNESTKDISSGPFHMKKEGKLQALSSDKSMDSELLQRTGAVPSIYQISFGIACYRNETVNSKSDNDFPDRES